MASDLGLHCLSLSRKNNARLLWANVYSCVIKEGFFHLDINYMYRLRGVNTVPARSSMLMSLFVFNAWNISDCECLKGHSITKSKHT